MNTSLHSITSWKLPECVVVNIEIIVSMTSIFANTFRVWVTLI